MRLFENLLIDEQIQWIQDLWKTGPISKGKYQGSYNTYHPLDKTKKLSQKKARFTRYPRVQYKAGGKESSNYLTLSRLVTDVGDEMCW